MNLGEATKKVRAERVKDNFMTIQLDAKLILPMKAGLAFIEALTNAEKMPDWRDPYIKEFDKNSLTTSVMPHQEYERHKIAALMGVSAEEVLGAQKAMAKPTQQNP